MAKYRGSVKTSLSKIFCCGLLAAGLLTLAFVIAMTALSITQWIKETSNEVTRLQIRQLKSKLEATGTQISNKMQIDISDLHMVSNGERIVNLGAIPTVGD